MGSATRGWEAWAPKILEILTKSKHALSCMHFNPKTFAEIHLAQTLSCCGPSGLQQKFTDISQQKSLVTFGIFHLVSFSLIHSGFLNIVNYYDRNLPLHAQTSLLHYDFWCLPYTGNHSYNTGSRSSDITHHLE